MLEVIFYLMLRLLFVVMCEYKILTILTLREKEPFKYLKNRKKLEYKEYDINDKEYNKELNNFVKTMENNFNKEELSVMSNNIENLKIKEKSLKITSIIIKGKVCGTYSSNSNKIVIDKYTSFKDTVYHELLHMASTTKNNKCYNVGFCMRISTYKFGEKLNEGYTDIMANRYFNSPISYKIEVIIIQFIEMLIGQKEMEKLYLQSDLKGLVEILKKYTSEKEISSFICALDNIGKYHNNMDIKLQINKIISYLYLLYFNYFNEIYNKNKIQLEKYISSLNSLKKVLEELSFTLNKTYNTKDINDELKEIDVIKAKKLLNDVKFTYFY